MRSRCEKLLERALANGLNSREGLMWRVHCRACEECRTELFILETLQKQAQEERLHLGRRELDQLMSHMRQQSQAPASSAVWDWALRIACAWLILVGVALIALGPGGMGDGDENLAHKDAGVSPTASRLFAAADGSGRTSAPTAASTELYRNPAASSMDPPHSDDSIPGQSELDTSLQDLRERIDQRRESLMKMIEDDLGETNRNNVWEFSTPVGMSVA